MKNPYKHCAKRGRKQDRNVGLGNGKTYYLLMDIKSDWDNYLLTNDTPTHGRYEGKIEQRVNFSSEWIKEEGKMVILLSSWKKY